MLAGGAGIAVFWIGLVFSPRGVTLGDYLFAGDRAADTAMAVLLLGLPVALVQLIVRRTEAAVAFATGALGPWAASWLVFALHDAPGGLPVSWPDTPRTGSSALLIACGLGSLWWASKSQPEDDQELNPTFHVTGRVVAMTVSAVTAIAVIGGGLAIDSGGYSFADSLAGPGYAAVATAAGTEITADRSSGPSLDESSAPDDPTTGDSCRGSVCTDYPDRAATVTKLVRDSHSEVFQAGDGLDWIAQFASLPVGAPDGHIRDTFDRLVDRQPAVRVALSDDWPGQSPGNLIFFDPGPFASRQDAAAFCRMLGSSARTECTPVDVAPSR